MGTAGLSMVSSRRIIQIRHTRVSASMMMDAALSHWNILPPRFIHSTMQARPMTVRIRPRKSKPLAAPGTLLLGHLPMTIRKPMTASGRLDT